MLLPFLPLTVLLLLASLLFAGLLLLRASRRLALVAGLGPLLLIGALLTPTPAAPPPPTPAVLNLGQDAAFADWYAGHQVLAGAPVGPAQQLAGLLTQCFTFVCVQARPAQASTPAAMTFMNLGLVHAGAHSQHLQANAPMAPVLAAYLADQAGHGLNLWRTFGTAYGPATISGGRDAQVFDKAILLYPTGATDPSQVVRLPLGRWYYDRLYPSQADTPPDITPLRALLLSLALLLDAALALAGFVLPRLELGSPGYVGF